MSFRGQWRDIFSCRYIGIFVLAASPVHALLDAERDMSRHALQFYADGEHTDISIVESAVSPITFEVALFFYDIRAFSTLAE